MGSFRFKQFEVEQNHSAMKVNTDAVLLGAWMSVPGGETVRALDIGTGTGVIALMAGQRLAEAGVSAHIDAVEIEDEDIKAAYERYLAARVEVYGEEKAAARANARAAKQIAKKRTIFGTLFCDL